MKNYLESGRIYKKGVCSSRPQMTWSNETLSKAGSPFAVLENILFIKNIAQFEAF